MSTLNPGPLQTDSATGLCYRLMQPQAATPRRCLVLLHGVGGNELSVASLADGVAADTLVVLVRGPLTLGAQQFAWFQVAFTASGPRIVPEEAERSRQLLVELLAELQQQHGVSPAQTVLAGFSQGGIMSAGVALTAPESVAGFGLLSGRILPEIGVLSRNRRKFRQPINVACPAPGRWGRPNSRVTSRHFDHGNASRTSRPDCSGLDEAD